MKISHCFCGNQLPFEQCCSPFIQQNLLPETAEQLMRSRYSAFCVGNTEYLIQTHWPLDLASQKQIQQTIDNTQWLGLKILGNNLGTQGDQTGEVEFVAFFQEDGVQQLHENSRFSRVAGKWFYLAGKQLPAIKLSRNDSCFCGSGIKYKRCHG